jgi:hypothetical protein
MDGTHSFQVLLSCPSHNGYPPFRESRVSIHDPKGINLPQLQPEEAYINGAGADVGGHAVVASSAEKAWCPIAPISCGGLWR